MIGESVHACLSRACRRPSHMRIRYRSCGLLSRVVSYVPDRLVGIVLISVGYSKPGMVWNMGKVSKLY